jgi:hypothetical protein
MWQTGNAQSTSNTQVSNGFPQSPVNVTGLKRLSTKLS